MKKQYNFLVIFILIIFCSVSIYFFIQYKRNNFWTGKWIRQNSMQDIGGILNIKFKTKNTFLYSLNVFNGYFTGNIEGLATFSTSSAYGYVWDNNEIKCQVNFIKNNNNIIVATTNDDCSYFRGLQAFFTGTYIKNVIIK